MQYFEIAVKLLTGMIGILVFLSVLLLLEHWSVVCFIILT